MTKSKLFQRLEKASATNDLLLDQESTSLDVLLEGARGNLQHLVKGRLS